MGKEKENRNYYIIQVFAFSGAMSGEETGEGATACRLHPSMAIAVGQRTGGNFHTP